MLRVECEARAGLLVNLGGVRQSFDDRKRERDAAERCGECEVRLRVRRRFLYGGSRVALRASMDANNYTAER